MSIVKDHDDGLGVTGTTAQSTNRGYGGSAQACGAVMVGWWESTTIEMISFNLIEPTGGDVIGERIERIVDTNLGISMESWFFSKQSLYDGSNLGFRTARATLDGTIPSNNQFRIVSLICSVDDLAVAESQTVVEQGAGNVGAALTNGATADHTFVSQGVLSNDTAAGNNLAVTGEGFDGLIIGGVTADVGGFYHRISFAPAGGDTLNWGTTSVAGGGSGLVTLLQEGAASAGGGGSRPKAAPMQFPMGTGNWTMANGILTR